MKFKYGQYVTIINNPFYEHVRGRLIEVTNVYHNATDLRYKVMFADNNEVWFEESQLELVDASHASGREYVLNPHISHPIFSENSDTVYIPSNEQPLKRWLDSL